MKVGKLALGEIVSFVDDSIVKVLRLLTRKPGGQEGDGVRNDDTRPRR